MRIQLPMLIATIAVISSAAAAAAETATSVAPFGPAQASQTAVWTTRTLHNFGGFSDSCVALVEELRVLLLELGARASDLYIDQHGCRREVTLIDATFSVLMPVDKAGKNEAGTLEAGWQILELKTNLERPTMTPVHHIIYRNRAGLEYVTKTVLPLFAARDVKLISKAICDKTGVGLRAEVLTPTRQ